MKRAFVLFVLLGVACGAPDDSSDPGSSPSPGPTADPNGPQVLSFGTSVQVLEEDEIVRFVAVVTDPEGVDTLAGGTLTAPDGSVHYGAFQADDQGAYQLDVSWQQIHQASPIEFFSLTQPRDFHAQFFDEDGHTSVEVATVTLSCEPDNDAPFGCCDGDCTALHTSSNCAECGVTCAATEGCNGTTCAPGAFTAMASFNPDTLPDTCAAYCTSLGTQCVDACEHSFFGLHTVGLLSDGGSTAGTKDCYRALAELQPNETSLSLSCCCQ